MQQARMVANYMCDGHVAMAGDGRDCLRSCAVAVDYKDGVRMVAALGCLSSIGR